DCALLEAVLAGETSHVEGVDLANLRLAVPQTVVLEGLDQPVSKAFERGLSMLSRAGATIIEVEMRLFKEVTEATSKGGFSPVEALALHEEALANRGNEYDPHARSRFEQGRRQSAAD